jgi:hypothetical protein
MEKLDQKDINEFVNKWYTALDVHAPQVDFIDMLSRNDLKMVFPEATLSGLASFESWYQGVIRIFFDEVHTVKSVHSSISDDGMSADVKVVVQWEASSWNPPARFSKRIRCDAYQTWKVNLEEGKIVITLYVVDEIKYQKGSATL